jgi:queuine tRNA-ribosyltransferase
MHNVHYLIALMGSIRTAIMEDRYPAFLKAYFSKRYGGDLSNIPGWAVSALRTVNVDFLNVNEEY